MEQREMGVGKASVIEAIVSVELAAPPQARHCGTRIVDRHIDGGDQRGKAIGERTRSQTQWNPMPES
jgi:hypothetical protein